MYGATGEYMVYPIIDLIKREVTKLKEKEEGKGSYSGSVTNISNSKVVNYGEILTALESNDYVLTLQRNDPLNPKILTSAEMVFGDTMKLIIALIRKGKKLSQVKMSVFLKERVVEIHPNPFGMVTKDYNEYVRNRRAWIYYNNIYIDETKPEEEREAAYVKMTILAARNRDLRNLYNVEDNYTYEDLVRHLSNPLAMSRDDYSAYVVNKRIFIGTHPAITEEVKQKAQAENEQLRLKYDMKEDVYTYEELEPYLPNPFGMSDSDFIKYVGNKTEWLNIKDDPDMTPEEKELAREKLENANQALRDKYYYVGADYPYEELVEMLPEDPDNYEEKVLFTVLITLNYIGKVLSSVKSETIFVGEELQPSQE